MMDKVILRDLDDEQLARSRRTAFADWQEATFEMVEARTPAQQATAKEARRLAGQRLASRRAEDAKRSRRKHGGGL